MRLKSPAGCEQQRLSTAPDGSALDDWMRNTVLDEILTRKRKKEKK